MEVIEFINSLKEKDYKNKEELGGLDNIFSHEQNFCNGIGIFFYESMKNLGENKNLGDEKIKQILMKLYLDGNISIDYIDGKKHISKINNLSSRKNINTSQIESYILKLKKNIYDFIEKSEIGVEGYSNLELLKVDIEMQKKVFDYIIRNNEDLPKTEEIEKEISELITDHDTVLKEKKEIFMKKEVFIESYIKQDNFLLKTKKDIENEITNEITNVEKKIDDYFTHLYNKKISELNKKIYDFEFKKKLLETIKYIKMNNLDVNNFSNKTKTQLDNIGNIIDFLKDKAFDYDKDKVSETILKLDYIAIGDLLLDLYKKNLLYLSKRGEEKAYSIYYP